MKTEFWSFRGKILNATRYNSITIREKCFEIKLQRTRCKNEEKNNNFNDDAHK